MPALTAPLATSDVEVFTLWWISVAVVFVVVVVATGLLTNILVTVRNIDKNVNEIWTVGKRIANNTVQLWLLGRVNGVVGSIRTHAYAINDVAGAIARHAGTCHHCPTCAAPRSSGLRVQAAVDPGTAGAPAPDAG